MWLKPILFLFCIWIHFSGSAQYNFNIKHTFGETSHQIFSASYNAEGNYIVTTGSDNNIIIWNAESGIIYRTLAGLKKRPNVAVFSPQSDLVATGGEDNIITLWDTKSTSVITTFSGLQGVIKTLDISPDGKYLASGGTDRTVRIWDIKSTNVLFDLKGHKKDVNIVKFSSDSKILVSGGADKSIILWSMTTGSIIKSREIHSGWIRDADFSPDGTLIASCGDDNLIQISKIPDLTPVISLKGHKDWVQTIDFSTDGKYLLSGGHDQLIILWDIASGKILAQSEKQGQIVLSVDFCPVRSDFISASLLSENLETWALSDINNMKESALAEKTQGEQFKTQNPIGNYSKPEASMIELFAPVPVAGRIVNDKNSIYLIGRASDPEGINVLLINKNPVKLSEAGVFQFRLSLSKGENPVNITAINKRGKMNEVILGIDCTADSIPASEAGATKVTEGKYYALLIGINDYQSGEIADLDNPIKDAESLFEVLSTKYTFENDHIIFLKNPTQSDIITTLDDLAKKLTVNDNLLIFYAGHGYWDDKGKVGYWFPSDASRNNTVNWFRNSTLRDFIGSIESKHTLLIADACFSGAIFKTRAAFQDAPQGIKKLDALPSRKAMTSGILQEVPDVSVFIKFLVKRLAENEEKFLTSELLFSSFQTAVMNNSSNVPQFGVIQNVGDEGGDFIFIKR